MAIDVQRALQDPAYRKTLTPEELVLLPENPALTPELTEEDLGSVSGGEWRQKVVD